MTWSYSFIVLFDYDQQSCINEVKVIKTLCELKGRKHKCHFPNGQHWNTWLTVWRPSFFFSVCENVYSKADRPPFAPSPIPQCHNTAKADEKPSAATLAKVFASHSAGRCFDWSLIVTELKIKKHLIHVHFLLNNSWQHSESTWQRYCRYVIRGRRSRTNTLYHQL